ncbi:unnamed protein product [Brassica napus]|uniref:(rape) hypothetical protein n=1 Tax=Brassica napus TaxID=3708 RepID=A0A816LZV0_BRANA|nr:unnamed protein product [Brassica napus]
MRSQSYVSLDLFLSSFFGMLTSSVFSSSSGGFMADPSLEFKVVQNVSSKIIFDRF